MNIAEFKQNNPEYQDVPDTQLAFLLHRKYYQNAPIKGFLSQIGIDPAQAQMDAGRDESLWGYWSDQVSKNIEGETEQQQSERLYGQNMKAQPSGYLEGTARAGLQGATFGGGDEFVAGAAAALDPLVRGSGGSFSDRYNAYLGNERDKINNFRESNPKTALGAEIGGALIAPGVALNAVKGGSGIARAVKGASIAGAEGAVYGFNAGEGGFDNRRDNALLTGALSAGIGGSAPIVSKGLKNLFEGHLKNRAKKQIARKAPNLDSLRKLAEAKFAQADKVTGLDRDVLSQAFPKLYDKAIRQGLDDVLTPQSARALNRIEDAATNPSATTGFRELDILRRQAGVAAGNQGNRIEKSIGSGLVDGLDDVIDEAAPQLGSDVADARKMWGQLRRSELIDEAFSKAKNQASGFENGLRTQFRSLVNNKRKMKGFSPDEVKALETVAQGTAMANNAKRVGKFGIGLGQQSNGLLGLLGYATGGMSVPVIGTAAQKLGERATRKQADFAKALVASGGRVPSVELPATQRLFIEALQRRGARSVEAIR